MTLVHIGKSLHPLACSAAHHHSDWELVYNVKGSGVVFTKGGKHPFSPGSIIIYPPGTTHKKVADTEFEDYYLRMSSCDLFPQVYCTEDTQDRTLFHLIQVIFNCYHKENASSICDNLLDSLILLIRLDLTSNPSLNKNVQYLQNALVSHFYDAEFCIQDAMDQIPLSKDHLRRQFKQAFGLTPQDYLTQLRIENAKCLLNQGRHTDISVADVAYLSGYYDPLYFSRAFKKYVGISPSAYLTKSAKE